MPASINMDFNREEDLDIIRSVTKDHVYWWNRRVPESVALEEDLEFPEVTRQVIEAHFREFYWGVSHFPYKCHLSTDYVVEGGKRSAWRYSDNRTVTQH